MACKYCRTKVDVPALRQPVTYTLREADAFGPLTFFIMGGGWHLHRCVVVD